MNNIGNSLMAYQFVKRLVQPFSTWSAFKLGIIDDQGKVLVQRNKLSPEQSAVFGKFDVLVLNLKKLLARLPGGGSRIATIAAAMMLLREKQYDENDVDLLAEELENHIVSLKLNETLDLDKTPLIEARRNLGGKLCSCGGDLHTQEHNCDYDEAQDKVVWKRVRKCSNCGKETEIRKKAPSAAKLKRYADHEKTIEWLMKEELDTRPLINEDMGGGNSAGGGAVAGIGVGPKGEPGMTPPGKKRKLGELPKSNLMATMSTRKKPL